MKATKFTLAASVAFATLLAAGATTASADVTLKAQNGEMGSIPSDGGSSSSPDGSIPGPSIPKPQDPKPQDPKPQDPDGNNDNKNIKTYWVDTEGENLEEPAAGIQGSKTFAGYVLLSTTVDKDGNIVHTYSGQTTVNFTAKFNDGRPDANFTWTFPANTEVTYARLFEMAGLNPEDFDLNDQDWTGQLGSNATVVASNAEAVDSNIDADASINTGEGGSETNIVVSQKPSSSSSVSSSSSSKPSSSSSNNNDDNGAAPTLPNTGEAEQAGLAIAGLSLMGATVALAATRRRF